MPTNQPVAAVGLCLLGSICRPAATFDKPRATISAKVTPLNLEFDNDRVPWYPNQPLKLPERHESSGAKWWCAYSPLTSATVPSN